MRYCKEYYKTSRVLFHDKIWSLLLPHAYIIVNPWCFNVVFILLWTLSFRPSYDKYYVS